MSIKVYKFSRLRFIITGMQLIESVISKNNLGDIIEITKLTSGYSSTPYKISTHKGTYVLLTKKSHKTGRPMRYIEQAAVLKALEEAGYQHAPRLIDYDPSGSWILETFVNGKLMKNHPEVDNLGNWKKVLDATKELQKLKLRTLQSQCVTMGLEFNLDPQSPQKPSDEWTNRPLKTIQRLDRAGLVKKLQPLVDECLSFYESHRLEDMVLMFIMGDIGSTHIIVGGNNIHLVDWEMSGFRWKHKSDPTELNYIISHSRTAKKYRKELTAHAARLHKVEERILSSRIEAGLKVIKINDILWAASMYLQAFNHEIDDEPSKYESILNRRMGEYSQEYGYLFG